MIGVGVRECMVYDKAALPLLFLIISGFHQKHTILLPLRQTGCIKDDYAACSAVSVSTEFPHSKWFSSGHCTDDDLWSQVIASSVASVEVV